MTRAAHNETPGTRGDQGSRPPQPEVIRPDQSTRRVASGPDDGHRRPRSGSRLRSKDVRPDPPLVDPNLPAAQDPVDVTLRNALQDLREVVVDALAGRILADREPVDSILA